MNEKQTLKLTYIAHSGFILSDGKYNLLFDPFITGNPNATIKASDVRADFIFVSHAHGDHLGDTVELAKANNGTLIAVHELAVWASEQGINAHGMSIGGEYNFPFGSLKLTIAHHGSKAPNGECMGPAAGAVVKFGGKTIYYCGDTGLFLDMKLIGEISKPEIMLVPIGDNYTMGIDDAVRAVEFVKPQLVIPMHYNTFPPIQADPKEFASKVEKLGVNVKVLNFGETVEL